MEITVTTGTNSKSRRVTRVRVEISDHDLATLPDNPDLLMRVITRSKNAPADRLYALADLGVKIVRAAKTKAKK